MKSLAWTGLLSLALILTGCGEGGDQKGGVTATSNEASAPPVKAPENGDWSTVVVEMPSGGMRMGNPEAPVKLIEFASLTCPHCATFAETGLTPLIDKYVKTGKVSLEFRNFLLNPIDLSASLLARCGGAEPFFPLVDQMFAAQRDWLGKMQQMSQSDLQLLQNMPPQQAVGVIAEQTGLVEFVRVRGISSEKARQCLANQTEMQKLVEMRQKAIEEFPDLPGTPSFAINGKLVEDAATWDKLEPKIEEALR